MCSLDHSLLLPPSLSVLLPIFAAAVVELISPSLENGVFDVLEGNQVSVIIATMGFSYGNIPLNFSLITYSDYAALGFNIEDEFNSSQLPQDAASCRFFLRDWFKCI